METKESPEVEEGGQLTLMVRRTIRATPERLFEAWTTPAQMLEWWGPAHVRCAGAEVDLRVGGAYRIGNGLPDGTVIWISGEFERVSPPHELTYTWRVEPGGVGTQRVTVRFEGRGAVTEVIILHERIADETWRDDHAMGWAGCLDGLEALVGGEAQG